MIEARNGLNGTANVMAVGGVQLADGRMFGVTTKDLVGFLCSVEVAVNNYTELQVQARSFRTCQVCRYLRR